MKSGWPVPLLLPLLLPLRHQAIVPVHCRLLRVLPQA